MYIQIAHRPHFHQVISPIPTPTLSSVTSPLRLYLKDTVQEYLSHGPHVSPSGLLYPTPSLMPFPYRIYMYLKDASHIFHQEADIFHTVHMFHKVICPIPTPTLSYESDLPPDIIPQKYHPHLQPRSQYLSHHPRVSPSGLPFLLVLRGSSLTGTQRSSCSVWRRELPSAGSPSQDPCRQRAQTQAGQHNELLPGKEAGFQEFTSIQVIPMYSAWKITYLEKSVISLFLEQKGYMSRPMTKPTKWLCTQRRLRSAWASAQSHQSHHCLHEETFGSSATECTEKSLIRLGICPGWTESSQSFLLILSWGGSVMFGYTIMALWPRETEKEGIVG